MPNANADAILVDVGVAYRAPECSWYIKVSQFKKLPKQEKSQGDKSSLELPVQVPVATNPQHKHTYRLGWPRGREITTNTDGSAYAWSYSF
jgi:hypothetical protein